MIQKTDLRILNLMLEKIDRLIELNNKYNLKEIESNYVISDAIQFEFEKLYEDSTRLSIELRIAYPNLPFDELRSIRNRIAHDYESVIIKILVDTINDDLPGLKNKIKEIIK